MTQSVPALSILFMLISGCIAILLPVTLFLLLRRRTRVSFAPVLVGAATFVVFVFILEFALASALMRGETTRAILTGNALVYALYGSLLAGVFEETGRLCAFLLLKKRHNSLPAALAYGIGHGGAEAILLVGLTQINNIVFSVMINIGGLESLRRTVPSTDQLLPLITTTPHWFLAAGVERIGAVAFHIAASVLVWLAVSGRGPKRLYLLAIGLHALVNLPVGLYQYGFGPLQNVWLVEALVILLAGAVCLLTYRIWRLYRGEAPPRAKAPAGGVPKLLEEEPDGSGDAPPPDGEPEGEPDDEPQREGQDRS